MADLDHAMRDIYKYFVNGSFVAAKPVALHTGGFEHRPQKLKFGAQCGGYAPYFLNFLIPNTALRHLNGTLCVQIQIIKIYLS